MSQDKPIRVAVASDQDIYRRGLVSFILSLNHTRLVGEARNEEEAVQLCELLEPDILLLDLKNLPEGGRELANTIHQRWRQVKVVFLLSSHEESLPYEGHGSQEMFYFSKDISEQEFSKALLDVYHSTSAVPSHEIVGLSGEQTAAGDLSGQAAAPASPSETPDQARNRELQMAGRVQADIMPENVPSIQGWDIAARLSAARETSGDFFDFIPLSPEHWGIVIGDVTDKGIGAALFMALTSTLIRTYAARYPTLPALTMDVVNQRMLTDTRGSMFVTAFFGVLEPKLGRLRFANAGHPPGLMVSSRGAKPVDLLMPTGVALGLLEKSHWKQKVLRMSPGDTLLLYTDGVTEAQNRNGENFGEHRLMRVLRANAGKPTKSLLDAVLTEVEQFSSLSRQRDDIALIAIRKKL